MLARNLAGVRTLLVCLAALVCVTILATGGLISGQEALYAIGAALGVGGGKGLVEVVMGRRVAKTRAGD
jgi:hypothetical protein